VHFFGENGGVLEREVKGISVVRSKNREKYIYGRR
jgi:hypothetical protein